MAYDRDHSRHRTRGEQERWHNDRHDGRGRSGGRDDRGFLERAGDEISSWFGDDDHRERGRERPHGGRDHSERDRQHGRSWFGRSDRDRPEGGNWFGGHDRDREEERNWFGGRNRDEQRGYGSPERMSGQPRPSGQTRWSGSDRDRDDRDYRPMTGDYGRSERFSGSRPDSKWEQDDYRRTSFAGSRDRSQHHDPHYNQWRERQLGELDRDYDEYHRERQSRFEEDFGSWRERRQQKRQTVGQVREHMEVVGNDGEHVGTVDKTAGDRIILTRSDPDAGGAHHSISCNDVDCIDDNKVRLDCTADEAKKRWRNEDRSRALFEREGQGEDGPHILDRSFSGTYRD